MLEVILNYKEESWWSWFIIAGYDFRVKPNSCKKNIISINVQIILKFQNGNKTPNTEYNKNE